MYGSGGVTSGEMPFVHSSRMAYLGRLKSSRYQGTRWAAGGTADRAREAKPQQHRAERNAKATCPLRA